MISGNLRSNTSPSKRPMGHTYEFLDWAGDNQAFNNAGDFKITVTLKDLTAGKVISRRGIAKMIGNFGAMYIDALEGFSDVYIGVSKHGIPAKVRKVGSGSKMYYSLDAVN
jgi:hypothetical protein